VFVVLLIHTLTQYKYTIINRNLARPGRNSLDSGPSHAISIKSRWFFLAKGVPQQSFNVIHRGELPLTLSSGWTEDQGRNTITKLPKTAYNSFSKVGIQLI